MEQDFWDERWTQGRIGFHENEGNTLLRQCFPKWIESGTKGANVLVPLCGKSVDLLWLRQQGLEVCGVEFVETGVRAFFTEQGLDPQLHAHTQASEYKTDGLSIWCGDFFAQRSQDLGTFDYIYDRAALVALPEPTRTRYAQHLGSFARPKARLLLVTFSYDQELLRGPPFSIDEAEVERLFAADWDFQRVHSGPADLLPSRMRADGLEGALEEVWLLERKA